MAKKRRSKRATKGDLQLIEFIDALVETEDNHPSVTNEQLAAAYEIMRLQAVDGVATRLEGLAEAAQAEPAE